MLKKLLIILSVVLPLSAAAQTINTASVLSPFVTTSTPPNGIVPRNLGASLLIPSLGSSASPCVKIASTTGLFATTTCGSGGGTPLNTNPFIATYFTATSTSATSTFPQENSTNISLTNQGGLYSDLYDLLYHSAPASSLFASYPDTVSLGLKQKPSDLATTTGLSASQSLVIVGNYVYEGSFNQGIQKINIDTWTVATTSPYSCQFDKLVYDKNNNEIYGLCDDTSVVQIDPNTVVITPVISAVGSPGNTSSMATDGTYLYILLDASPSVIFKYQISNYSQVASTTLTGYNQGAEIEYDGNMLYATGLGDFVASINPSSLAYQATTTDGVAPSCNEANQMAVAPDYIFLACENAHFLIQVQKTNIGNQLAIATNASYGSYWDGNYVWDFGGSANPFLYRYNPYTTELIQITPPEVATNGVNKMVGDGERLIYSTYADGLMYRISPTALLNGAITENYSNLNVAQNIKLGSLTNPGSFVDIYGNLFVQGEYIDGGFSPGSSGKILTSTGSATSWKSPSSIPGVNYFSNSGATTTLITGTVLSATTGQFSTINATSTSATSTISQALWIANVGSTTAEAANIINRLQVGPDMSNVSLGSNATSSPGLGNAIFNDNGRNLLVISAHGVDFNDSLAGINTIQSRGTTAAPTATQSGDDLYFMGARGYGTTVYANGSRAAIVEQAAQNWTDSAQGTDIEFEVTPLNSVIRKANVMTISPAGNIGIGTSSPTNPLEVNGNGFFNGTITSTATTTTAGLNISNLKNVVLSTDANGNVIATTTGSALSGGTANQLAYWTSPTALSATTTFTMTGLTIATTTPSAFPLINELLNTTANGNSAASTSGEIDLNYYYPALPVLSGNNSYGGLKIYNEIDPNNSLVPAVVIDPANVGGERIYFGTGPHQAIVNFANTGSLESLPKSMLQNAIPNASSGCPGNTCAYFGNNIGEQMFIYQGFITPEQDYLGNIGGQNNFAYMGYSNTAGLPNYIYDSTSTTPTTHSAWRKLGNNLMVLQTNGSLGLATSTPAYFFTLASSTSVGSSTNLFSVSSKGSQISGGGTPSVSCASTCTLSTHSNDTSGTIFISGVQTAVTLTFSVAKEWAPNCVISDNVTSGNYDASSTATALSMSTAVSLGTASITYFCPL